MISNISEFDMNATDNELVVRLPTTEPRFFSAFVECILGEDNQKVFLGPNSYGKVQGETYHTACFSARHFVYINLIDPSTTLQDSTVQWLRPRFLRLDCLRLNLHSVPQSCLILASYGNSLCFSVIICKRRRIEFTSEDFIEDSIACKALNQCPAHSESSTNLSYYYYYPICKLRKLRLACSGAKI